MYLPREDSFLLLRTIQELDPRGELGLDMGTGSGILAFELSKRFSRVIAVDVNEKVLEKLKGRVPENVELRQSNLFENVPEKFDLIVFNPPYLPCPYEEDPEVCCGKDAWLIRTFLGEARKHLKKGAFILLLISSLTPIKLEEIERLYILEIVNKLKLDFEELLVLRLIPWTGSS